jgi:hypothetical protein
MLLHVAWVAEYQSVPIDRNQLFNSIRTSLHIMISHEEIATICLFSTKFRIAINIKNPTSLSTW